MRSRRPRPDSKPAARARPPQRTEPPRRVAERVARPAAERGWDHVAAWYDQLVGERGSDYHEKVILPAAVRMLDPQPGARYLDLCCGQGVLARRLLSVEPREILGVDASPQLIEAARRRTGDDPRARFLVGDVRQPLQLREGAYDSAACIMAVQDLNELTGPFQNVARALRPGGRFVIVAMHPCFRIPRQTAWGWDEARKMQYRRIDRYGTPLTVPISTHPGRNAETHTNFHHWPLATMIQALSAAGLAVDGCEELCSHRRSTTGGKSRGENRAAQEIPLFLALRAVRLAAP